MSVIASYSNLALVNTGKQGVLKKLDNSYYEMMLGAVGAIGNGGWTYDAAGCMNYLKTNPDFLRRLKAGQLKMEWGHPVRELGMSDGAWFARVNNVLESNTCAAIRDIKFTTGDVIKDARGRSVVGIIGEIAPCGKQATSFRDMLENPHMDVNASVRSFTDNNTRTGLKTFLNVITWDYVTYPGIKETTKYNTPSMEGELMAMSLDEAEFDLVNIRLDFMRSQAANDISMETRDQLLYSIEMMEAEHARLQKFINPGRVPTTITNW